MTEAPQPQSLLNPASEELLAIVRAHPMLLQFKNSLKFVQGSTNMTLDRMIVALDMLCANVYADGVRDGIKQASEITMAAFDRSSADTDTPIPLKETPKP